MFVKTWKILILGALLATLAGSAPAAQENGSTQAPAQHQVLLEAGAVWPGGDLRKEFLQSPQGFGADAGVEIGFRYRYYFHSHLSLSPSFHFVNFRPHFGKDPELEEYTVRSTSYRYSLELLLQKRKSRATLRPFLGIGAGLYRNRLQGWDKDLATAIDGSTNTLGLFFRGGLRHGDFEFSMVYHRNRFETWQFFWTSCCQSYSWDSVSLRLGWSFP